MTAAVVLLAAAVLVLPWSRPFPAARSAATARRQSSPLAPRPGGARSIVAGVADPVRSRPGPASRSDEPRTRPTAGEVAEVTRLLAAALRSGVGVLEALEVVAELGPAGARDLRVVVAAQRWGDAAGVAWRKADQQWAPVAQALVAAEDAGISPVRALEAASERMGREHRRLVVEAVRQVEVLVVLPLGLALLPGFLLTAVVPVVAALAGSVLDP